MYKVSGGLRKHSGCGVVDCRRVTCCRVDAWLDIGAALDNRFEWRVPARALKCPAPCGPCTRQAWRHDAEGHRCGQSPRHTTGT